MHFNSFLYRAFSYLAIEEIEKARRDFEIVLLYEQNYLTQQENNDRKNLKLNLENIIHVF